MELGQNGERSPKRALGRGLSALIPQAQIVSAGVPVQGELPPKGGIVRLPIESVQRATGQPRKVFDEAKLQELAESIKAQGLIQPVLVRRNGEGYKLIAGERRWRAAQMAGLKELPAIVREASDAEAFELALVENLQRADLNPIEEAEGYRRLVDEFRFTQEQVSQRVGKERSSVANALRLLGLPESVKVMLADGSITAGHAKALLGAKNGEVAKIAEKISAQRLSVREAERLVRDARDARDDGAAAKDGAKDGARDGAKAKQSPQARQVVEQLQRRLGTKVRLFDRGGKGTIEIDFFSYEDLDRLINLFGK